MRPIESYCEGQHRKRRGSPERHDSSKRRLFSNLKYSSSRRKLDPILVFVTPLRHKQGEILERNLRDAGADILDFDHEKLTSPAPLPSRILIVTDDANRASARLKSPLGHSSITYVSVKWASAVLAAREWVPHESYVLLRNDLGSSVEKTSDRRQEAEANSHARPVIEPGPSSVSAYPVWYSGGVNESSDISEKIQFMKSLPSYPCQRCTITQSIFLSPNRKLCDLLEQVAEKRLLERAGGDTFSADIRARAYRRANSALKCVPFNLKTSKDAEWLHSFGPRVLAVANEYLTTGTVLEVELLKTDERLQAMSAFTQLYGVGYSSAQKFYDEYEVKNVTQLQDRVREEPEKFPDVLVKYLSHYDDLCRTSRSEAEAFKDLVENIANEPEEGSLHLRFKLCGGFRRGEVSGHDVDLLYCRRAEQVDNHNSVLTELVDRLCRRGLIKSVLRLTCDRYGWADVHYHQRSNSIYPYAHDILHGIAEHNGYKFRLDIVGVRDASEFCFATLAWSGSTSFQRDIRLWCENQKKWHFGHHGLFHVESGQRVKLDPVPQSEMDIFSAIGLTYRPPYERSC